MQRAELGGYRSTITLRGNVIRIEDYYMLGKAVHLLILHTTKVKFLLLPLATLYVPKVSPSDRESHMIPAVILKMLVFCFVYTQGAHGIIHTQCVFGCTAKDDVASFYLARRYLDIYLLKRTFRFSVLRLVFFPVLTGLGVSFFGIELLYGSMNGSVAALALIHSIDKNIVAHEPLAYLPHAVLLGCREYYRLATGHCRTEETTVGVLRSNLLRGEAHEQRIPRCAMNNLANVLTVADYVGQRDPQQGVYTEVLVEHVGRERTAKAEARQSFVKRHFTPKGCKLLR